MTNTQNPSPSFNKQLAIAVFGGDNLRDNQWGESNCVARISTRGMSDSDIKILQSNLQELGINSESEAKIGHGDIKISQVTVEDRENVAVLGYLVKGLIDTVEWKNFQGALAYASIKNMQPIEVRALSNALQFWGVKPDIHSNDTAGSELDKSLSIPWSYFKALYPEPEPLSPFKRGVGAVRRLLHLEK